MIFNCPKRARKTKQRRLNTCFTNKIQINLSLLDLKISLNRSPLESSMSKMSTLTTDINSARVAAAAGKKEIAINPPMNSVVVNSIIYSKPSFCRIAVDVGNIPSDTKSSATSNMSNSSTCSNDILHAKTLCSSLTNFSNLNLNFNAASCLGRLSACSSIDVDKDAQVYRMCTTMNGSIHHQVSDLCDNILAMAEFIGATNNQQEDDSLIEFTYKDDGDEDNLADDFDEDTTDDNDEDCVDDEYDDYNEDLDDDYDVVDFSYECPIEPVLKWNCYKKKRVRFNNKPIVHVMHTWCYAYRAARKGEWEMHARDRERFKLRIYRAAVTLNPILEKEHRQQIFEKRFAKIYDNDESQQALDIEYFPTTHTMESTEAIKKIESKKIHQKKKRKKKRFCKMGNKHYF